MKQGCYKYVDNPGPKPNILENTGVIDKNTGYSIGIARKDIKKYITPELLELLNIYKISKHWGLPNGKGWLDEPVYLIEAFTVFDTELADGFSR